MYDHGQAWVGARTLRPARIAAAAVVAALTVCGARAEEPVRLATPELGRFAFGLAGHGSAFHERSGAEFRPGHLEQKLPQRSGNFYDAHLIPRLNTQFGNMSAYHFLPGAGRDLGEWVMFDELTEIAKSRAERGTRRALKDYLLEVSSLERSVDAVRDSGDGNDAGPQRPLRFGLKISHGTPKVDMRYRLSSAVVRLGIRADGSVSAEFRRARGAGQTWIVARYDADGDYNLLCRLSF